MRSKYIDVLKALAIITVVLYHAGVLTYGYLGVDIFLVIAGFFTTKSLSGHNINEGSFAHNYINFEINRIIRLIPLILVAGLFCMALGYFVMLPDDYENLSESVVASNLFSNNILAAITTKNYWDVVNEYKPLMHTWYVGVIMQFYIVYPILFYLSRLDKRNPKGTLLTILATLAVISLLVYFATTDTAQRFYYLPSRFFEFAVGGIAALLYNPQEHKPFRKGFVYVCYILLITLVFANADVIPASIRLVAVVCLSCTLLCSRDVLENKVTGNTFISKIGAASYSIFIWHQVILAYIRYTITSDFSIIVYIVIIIITALISWLSYHFIEERITRVLKVANRKRSLYATVMIVFVLLTSFSLYIYKQGGVVRDVPELYITKGEKTDHRLYNDKIYAYDKPFETNKQHWLVIGNSFGRDFANVILESEVADSVELSYIFIDQFDNLKYNDRIASADRIFISTLGVNEDFVTTMEVICQANNVPIDHLIVVSEKNFGECNGQYYVKRGRPDYFEQRTQFSQKRVKLSKHEHFKIRYGERYLDLIGLVMANDGSMPVFTPDHHYISQDCEHFSMGGAKWFATLIEWKKYLDK